MPSATPNPNINATTSYRYQNVPDPTDIGTLLANNGVTGYDFDSRRMVDLDGDGTEEIVVAAGRDVTTSSPARVFQRQGDGSYADATVAYFGTSVPGQVHPRKTIAADFNGDGRLDLVIGDNSAIIPSCNFRWMNDGGGNFAKTP